MKKMPFSRLVATLLTMLIIYSSWPLNLAGAEDSHVINTGESWRFTNTDTVSHAVKTDGNSYSGRTFDSVIYNSDGTPNGQAMDDSTKSMTIPAGGYVIVTGTGRNPVNFGGMYPYFEGVSNPEPALCKKALAAGENWKVQKL